MKYERGQQSDHVEDRRGARTRRGGMGGLQLPGGKGGGIVAVLGLIVALVLGGTQILDGGSGNEGTVITDILGSLTGQAPPPSGPEPLPGVDPEADLVDFVEFVVDDIQTTWTELFTASGKTYEPATLVLFRDVVDTGCGQAGSDVGPFYCPPDRKAYIDLAFFEELSRQFGAPGDFAQAYVIAHEIGHHVQNLLGVNADVRARSEADPSQANELSILMELQADCFAGVWAHATYERDLLQRGDLEEGLGAAAAVGDDRIQSSAGAEVNPETWTHGSSEQRTTWFQRGYESGDPKTCDTFAS